MNEVCKHKWAIDSDMYSQRHYLCEKCDLRISEKEHPDVKKVYWDQFVMEMPGFLYLENKDLLGIKDILEIALSEANRELSKRNQLNSVSHLEFDRNRR